MPAILVSGGGAADTELPASGALVDAAVNPNTPLIGSCLLQFNGATWDRARGDISNGVDVDVTRIPSSTNAGATAKTSDYDTGAGVDTVTMFGIALPKSGGAAAGGTSADPLRIDPTGTTTQPVSGTVTANIGTSGSLALDATVTGLQLSQGSTTAGQKGELIQGAVTTSAPAYTTAQTSPLSLTTAGALRTDSSAVTQPVSGTITANAGTGTFAANTSQINGVAPSMGNGVSGTGVQRVTLASDSTGQVALAAGTASIGTANTIKISPTKTTYSASTIGLAPAASATDIFEIAGSASKTIKVTRLSVSGTATSAGAYDFALIKRSTANSAGTSTTETGVPHDSNNAAVTAVVKSYTANPTLGTSVGRVRNVKGTVTTSAGGIPGIVYEFKFGESVGQELVLRGTAQLLALNLNATSITGGSLDIDVEWTEE